MKHILLTKNISDSAIGRWIIFLFSIDEGKISNWVLSERLKDKESLLSKEVLNDNKILNIDSKILLWNVFYTQEKC